MDNLFDKIELISVNYKTPDFIIKQYYNIRKFIGNINIRIIDGSGFVVEELDKIEQTDTNFKIIYFDFNIHHGPGMDYALRTSKFPYLLIMDSDCWPVKPNLLVDMWKLMENDIYGVAYLNTNKYGCKYMNAYCMLLNRQIYLKYPKFVFHGAPLKDLHSEICKLGISDKIYKNIKISEYTNWSPTNPGRGTRKRYGSDWYTKRKKEIPVNKKTLEYKELCILIPPFIKLKSEYSKTKIRIEKPKRLASKRRRR